MMTDIPSESLQSDVAPVSASTPPATVTEGSPPVAPPAEASTPDTGTETSSQPAPKSTPAPEATEEHPTAEPTATPETPAPPAEGSNKQWYVVKVQSGREETVKEAIERRVKIEGLEQYFGQVVVPMERETVTIQSGKRKGQKTVRKKKKFPGYIMAQVELNEKILYLFRETSGVGDFVGASQNRKPVPMSEREVAAMLRDQEDVKGILPSVKESKKRGAPAKLPFAVGDKVRVREGIFSGQEGEIKEIREPKDETETHRISVELTVFGRPTRVQLEHWQIESI